MDKGCVVPCVGKEQLKQGQVQCVVFVLTELRYGDTNCDTVQFCMLAIMTALHHTDLWQHVGLQEGSASEGSGAGKEGARNIRSSALRFWAALLERFPDSTDYNFFWERFLAAVEPQMPRMAIEVGSSQSTCSVPGKYRRTFPGCDAIVGQSHCWCLQHKAKVCSTTRQVCSLL